MTRLRSLRLRLISAVISTTAIVVALAAMTTWMASARARSLAFDQAVRDHARTLRPQMETMAWRHIHEPGLAPELLPTAPELDDLVMVLRGADGRVFAHSTGQPMNAEWISEHPGSDGVLVDAEMPHLGSVRWMVLSIVGRPPPRSAQRPNQPPPRDNVARPPRDDEPIPDHPGSNQAPVREQPTAQLVMIRPIRAMRAELAGQAWQLAGMALAICLVTALLVAWVISRLLRPVRQLSAGITGMVPGSRASLAVPDLPNELLPVQACLNELLSRVDEVLERERQTTANIAHELRTPLTGLRAKLELALMRDRDPEQIAGLCRQGLATMTILQGLVDNLLLLARLEAGQAELHREAVEVAEVVASGWSLHHVSAEERGLRLERAIEPALAITTDVGKLRAILSNLLSNAVAYADPGSAIHLEATEESTGIRIVVSNEGATITAAETERVFEPFWRGDAARTVESGHCGLGLPLVRRLAAILGGSVTVAVVGRRFSAILLLRNLP